MSKKMNWIWYHVYEIWSTASALGFGLNGGLSIVFLEQCETWVSVSVLLFKIPPNSGASHKLVLRKLVLRRPTLKFVFSNQVVLHVSITTVLTIDEPLMCSFFFLDWIELILHDAGYTKGISYNSVVWECSSVAEHWQLKLRVLCSISNAYHFYLFHQSPHNIEQCLF